MAELLDWVLGAPPVPSPPSAAAAPGAPAPAPAPARRGPADWLGGRGAAPPAVAPPPVAASQREPEAPRGTVIQGGAGTTAEEVGRRLWQDAGAVQDLEALLANPAQAPAKTFSAPQPGAPGLLRRRGAAEPLPEVVRECYGSGNHVVCLAGVFPSIRRVWVTVDSSLFLWRSDRRGEIPLEYRGKEQAISAVGLVTPHRGIFWKAVQHLLVLCTPLEISLLGVVLQGGSSGGGRGAGAGLGQGGGDTGGGRGSGDELEELSLQPLPMYCVPSNGVMMLCTATTRGGRVFLGGDNGHLYELEYSSGEGWGQKRCRKVCHTSSIWNGLVGLVKGAVSPIEQISVDEERGVLYVRHRNSQLTVFDIGPECKTVPTKAGECLSVPEACRAWGVGPHGLGKRLFGTTPTVRPGEISPAAIINMAPVPRSDSHRLHMVATTADGRRVYFSTTSSYSVWGGPAGPASQLAKVSPRPTDLRVKMVRGSPVVPSVHSGTRMDVEYGFYREGLVLLSHSRKGTGGGAISELVSCSRDLTAATDGGARRDFAEMVGVCDVEGVSCAIGEVSMPAILLGAAPMQGPGAGPVPGSGGRSDLLLQHVLPPRRLVLLSNLGVEEIEKLRPIDVLAQMLRDGGRDFILHFFKSYGVVEACAMCLILATPVAIADTAEAKDLLEVFQRSYGLPRSEAEAVQGALSCSAVVVEAARKVYEDAAFVGEPIEEPAKPIGATSGGYGDATATDTAAKALIPKIHFSGAYEGLALYAARLVAPLWEHSLMFERKAGDRVKVYLRLGAGTLRVLEERVRALEKYLHACECRRLASTPAFTSGGARGYEAEPWGMQYVPGGHAYAQRQAANKRQRVEVAAEREAKAASAMRVTLMRASEAIKILRLVLEHVGEDVSVIVDRLDAITRGHLVRSSGAGGHGNFGLRARQQHYTTLRDLVTTEEGEVVVRGLIAALMAHQMSVGRGQEVDELGRGLEKGCPTFFRSDDRTFYDARLVLKRAQAAKAEAERAALVKQALASLLKVPSVVNLPAVVPELATLGCWEGVVELPLRACAAADPSNLAVRSGPHGEQARACRAANYGLVTAELRRLAPSVEEVQLAASASRAQGEALKGLTPTQRAQAREKLLTIAFASRDRFFHEYVYAHLMEQGRAGQQELARLRPPFLEEFLRVRGGLPPGPGLVPGELPPLGPLAPSGVQALELLAELYGEGSQAAQVQLMLSQRKCGPAVEGGEGDVTLEKRRKHLSKAVELMRGGGDSLTVGGSSGGTVGVDYFETKLRVLEMQCELRDSLNKAAQRAGELKLPEVEVSDLRRKSESLSESLLDLTDLYNDYAFPDQFWGLCLEMLHLAKYSDPLTIQDLWDKHLGSAATSGELEGSNLAAACECVVGLGKKFWPNEALLPLQHVAGRLDEVAAGLWPEQTASASPDSTERMVMGLLEATGNSAENLRRAYDSLLLRPSSHPALKLQHLRSLASLMGHMAKEVRGVIERGATPCLLGSGTLRDVGSFTSLLERYILSARNLPVPGALSGPVAVSFEQLYNEVPAFADPLA